MRVTERDRLRFLEKVPHRPKGKCWLWRAQISRAGYGVFSKCVRGAQRRYIASRVAFLLTHGRWPMPVCRHTCDVRACVNPAHLVAGSRAQNNHDMKHRGRARGGRGERNRKSVLTRAQVRAIRRSRWGCRRLARRYGVTRSAILHIRQGRNWKWLCS